MSQQKQRHEPPRFGEASGEMYMIIRFKNDMVQRVNNAFTIEKSVLRQYHGHLLGTAHPDTVCFLESRDKCDQRYSFAIVTFPNRQQAENWLCSDRIFKQKDWPDSADTLQITMFPMSYVPKENGYKVFQLIEICDIGVDDPTFQKEYIDKAASLMETFGIRHGLVATTEGIDLRRTWIKQKSFVVLHSYESMDHFNKFYKSPEYHCLKDYRQGVCNTTSVVFQIP